MVAQPFDSSLGTMNFSQFIHEDLTNNRRQSRGDSVAHLFELFRARPAKNKVVGEGLTSRSLSDSKGSALTYVRVNIIMPVFTNMRHYRRAWPLQPLHSKPINKLISVLVLRHQIGTFAFQIKEGRLSGTILMMFYEEFISLQVAFHVCARLEVNDAF
jgi:hypothetical protein